MATQAIFLTGSRESSGPTAQVSFANDEPLGVIAQDPFLAQHVPCITSMRSVPITRPCIGTDLCNPGTTSGHFAVGGEDDEHKKVIGK